MSISAKTTILIALMGALLSVSAFFIQRSVIYPAFHDIELDYARDNIDRVIRRLQTARNTIDLTVYDWSAWDDTYTFIDDGNQAYINSNLYPDTFLNFGFDVALFLNRELRPVWGRVFDFDPQEGIIDLTDTYLDDVLSRISPFTAEIDFDAGIDDQHQSGVVEVDGIPILFAIRPIVRSDGSGPHRGYVVFGQFLDKDLIADLSEQIVREFSVELIPEAHGEQDQSNYRIKALDSKTLSASAIFSIDGRPGLRATTILPRNITGLGNDITFFGVGLFILFCLVLAAVLLALFRWFVVNPIAELRADISNISNAMDYSLRTTARSNDEIGALSRDFNAMLAMIESQNTELQKLSEEDPLTGLSNRLAFEKKLDQAWDILLRTRGPLTVLLVDIDYFKLYNDRYGHQAGDETLKRVARILAGSVQRKTDMAGRYGGEEFILVLPGTDCDDALGIATSIRETVMKEKIQHEASPHQQILTVSIGISSVIPSDDASVVDLIGAADRALYKVKEGGRNQCRYEPVRRRPDNKS